MHPFINEDKLEQQATPKSEVQRFVQHSFAAKAGITSAAASCVIQFHSQLLHVDVGHPKFVPKPLHGLGSHCLRSIRKMVKPAVCWA